VDPSVFVVGASHVNVTTPLLVTVSVAVPAMLPDIAVIVVKPAATEVTKPLEPAALLIAATAAVDEDQVTAVVKFCVVLSEYVPVAVNCCIVPLRMLGLIGVTAMETSIAGVTVRVVDPDILPDIAVIIVEPAATDTAKPLEPAALLIAATAAADEFQVTAVVKFCVVLSEYVPVAVNCWVVPSAMLGLVGVTAMDTSVAEVTVSVVEPDIPPDVAVIVVEPTADDVASPLEPAELLMAATAAADEFQVTDAVRSCVVLSENVPVAVNCCVVPLTMLGLVGVTAMDASIAGVTVRVVNPDILPHVAVIVVEPADDEVASPLEVEPIALLMAATSAADEFQVASAVRSCVVLSENVPVAVNCCFVPSAMLGMAGVIASETSVACVTVTSVHPDLFPHFPQIFVLPQCVAVMYPER
jgi:hypothetical protein